MESRTVTRIFAAGIALMLSVYAPPLEAQELHSGEFRAGESAIVHHNLMVPMRDGTLLSTDVYRPAAPGRHPALLIRDPYDNGSDAASWEEGLRWAERGYVYVHQNVRGRFDSEGSWYPYLAEANDSHDTQNWIGRQEWSDGQVGTHGNSYLATTQWKGAEFRSPYLKAMAPRVTPFNYYFDTAYPGGALALGSRIGWASGMGGRTGQAGNPDWDQVLWTMPLLEMGAATGQDNPWWRDFVMHPTYDAYWEVLDSEARLDEFAAASLNIGGWYDVFLDGTLVSYTGMVEKGHTEYARENQKLLIGPWPHASVPNFVYDGIDFGPEATVDFDSLHVKWFDALLKGVDNGYLDEPPVRIFIMGENVWRSENEWPIARTQYTNYYFHSGGNANGSAGDGTLSTGMPGASDPVDEFVFDPMNPVPTRGGNLMFGPTPPAPSTARTSRSGTTSWCSPRRHWRRRWRSPARSRPPCTHRVPRPTPTSRRCSWTSTRTARKSTSRTASFAHGITTAPTSRTSSCWSRGRCTSSTSICGRPATSSGKATGSASRSRAATSRSTTATRTPAARSTSKRRSRPPIRRSTTTPGIRHTSRCR